MTTEDDFQRALDAHPDDWQTRLVFADWLQERGDARAEGYRALGALRRVPAHHLYEPMSHVDWAFSHGTTDGHPDWDWRHRPDRLPDDWSKLVNNRHVHTSRRVLEDVAALAFAKVPPARRAELLAVAPVG